MTIRRALAPWERPSIKVPSWQASLGGPIWMLNQPGEGDPSAQSGATGSTDGTTGQGAGTTDDKTGGGGGDAQSGAQSSSDDTVTRAEFERIQNQLRAADQKREAAEKQLAEIADKDKTELQRATERAEAAEKRSQQLESELQALKLEKAMLTDPEFGADKWHDPADALSALHRAVKDQQISLKDGEPDSAQVKAFLKDLAKKRQYLLKANAVGGGKSGPSGDPVGAGNRNDKGGMTDDQVRSKYRIK